MHARHFNNFSETFIIESNSKSGSSSLCRCSSEYIFGNFTKETFTFEMNIY